MLPTCSFEHSVYARVGVSQGEAERVMVNASQATEIVAFFRFALPVVLSPKQLCF